MSDELEHVRRAIELARRARESGNHPFGALLVAGGDVVLEAQNTVVTAGNPTHHAELNLVQRAWSELSSGVIQSSTLFSSTEPCPMCSGAIFWSGIRRVVFSTPASYLGEIVGERFCGPCTALFERAEEPTEVIGPVLPEEGREVHRGFWTEP